MPLFAVGATDAAWEFFAAHPMPGDPSAAQAVDWSSIDMSIPPGDHIELLQVGGLRREYRLHIPPNYDPDTPTPLVMVFHGRGGAADKLDGTTQFAAKADEEGFIVVYPQGLSDPSVWFYGMEGQGLPDDAQFVSEIIDSLASRLNIDPARVYAAGFSNGGGFANWLACKLTDKIAAFGSVAGSYQFTEQCSPSRPAPIVALHGYADDSVPYNGEMERAGIPPVRDWAADWAARNGCDAEFTEMPANDNGSIIARTWRGCLDDAEITLYSLEGFGHYWPRLDAPSSHPSRSDIDATDIMWDFFTAHPMPDEPSAAVTPVVETSIDFPPEPGDYTGSVASGGQARGFSIHIPPGYEHGAALPLVLDFHGYTGSPE
jgi:polyhydroxybutyrate depolymerase